MDEDLTPLIERISATTALSPAQARRVVEDVIAYLAESPEDYVLRRHRELKRRDGLRNDAIFELLSREASRRVFAVPALTARQIRRIIYG